MAISMEESNLVLQECIQRNGYSRFLHSGAFMIIGPSSNMLRSFFECILTYFMEYFFKNFTKSIKIV